MPRRRVLLAGVLSALMVGGGVVATRLDPDDTAAGEDVAATAELAALSAEDTTTTTTSVTVLSDTDVADGADAIVAEQSDAAERSSAAASVAASREGLVTWAIEDLATGVRIASDGGEQTAVKGASMGKVVIAVLAVERGVVTADDRLDELEAMIVSSDNDAAADLYDAIGGATAVDDLLTRLGMTSSHAGTSFGTIWLTSDDMVTLLAALADGSLLGADSDLVLDPMRRVVDDQRWGIAESVADGVTVALKNGWYPAEEGLWRVHCSAVVGDADATAADEGVVVTVMTNYPVELGQDYGEESCRLVAAALLPDALTA